MAKAKGKVSYNNARDRRQRLIKMLKAYQQDTTYLTAKCHKPNIKFVGEEPDVGNATPILSREMAADMLLPNDEKRALVDELRAALWHQYPRYASTMSKCIYRHCGLSARGGRACAACTTKRLVALLTRDVNERKILGERKGPDGRFSRTKLYGPWAARNLHAAIKRARELEGFIDKTVNDMYPRGADESSASTEDGDSAIDAV
jgi:hypothetical protein